MVGRTDFWDINGADERSQYIFLVSLIIPKLPSVSVSVCENISAKNNYIFNHENGLLKSTSALDQTKNAGALKEIFLW